MEERWSTLHQFLLCNRAISTELPEFYTEAGAVGFSDLAEAPGWWLFLRILQEHYKLINEALSEIQGAVLIMEQQNNILIQLRKDLSELRCIQESATADIAEDQEDELPVITVLGITTMVEELETRASLSWISIYYRNISEKSCELGMDARNVYDELYDECDEERTDVARDVAAIALKSVHRAVYHGHTVKSG
jgi:adenylate cyclase